MTCSTHAPDGATHADPLVACLRAVCAYERVMVWSGWQCESLGARQGSELVAALESAREGVRRSFPELLDAVMITGSGRSAYGVTWGHFNPTRWRDAITAGRRPEVFIGGERLATGGTLTMQTLLHEAAHELAFVRDVKDTSRGHRYHNQRFVAIARELGLDYTAESPDPTIGWSAVVLTPEGKNRWGSEIRLLDDAISLAMDDPTRWLAGAGGSPVGGGGHGVRVKGGGKGTGGTSNVKVSCPECSRIGRFSAAQLARGPIFCGADDHSGETYEMI